MIPAALADALRGLDAPRLVVDLDAFEANCDAVRALVQPGVAVRLVAKSLPSAPLLDLARQRLGARGMMTFSAAQIVAILAAFPEEDQLLGKPLPAAAAARLIEAHPEAVARVQWLIDSPARLAEYAALDLPLRVALELDIGLHRGGFGAPDDIAAAVETLRAGPMRLTGAMGYEAHLAKLPGPLRRRAEAHAAEVWRAMKDAAGPGDFCWNTGGSLTFAGYDAAACTEVSLGSVLALPSHFETPATCALQPAAWIASPVLKVLGPSALPGFAQDHALNRVLAQLSGRQRIAIAGGNWLADPAWPSGARVSRVFGPSSNQEVWSVPAASAVRSGDIALARPQQSEAVLASFGPILALRGGAAVAEWPIF